MSPRVTASGLDRAFACGASTALPRTASTSSAAERGTSLHAFLAALCQGTPREQALGLLTDDARYTGELLRLEDVLCGRAVVGIEMAFALDPMTGKVRHLGNDIGRAYDASGLRDHEIAGSLDLVLRAADGRVTCVDLKTGQPTTPAHRNRQLAFAAYCVAKYLVLDEVDVALCYLGEDADVVWDRASYDALALEAFAAELREAYALWAAAGTALEPVPGKHCAFCASRPHCPAWGAQVPQLMSLRAGDWMATLQTQLEDDEAAAYWAQKVRDAEALLDLVKAAVYARAKARPIPMGDGTALAYRREARTVIDHAIARRVIRDAFGEDAANDAFETKTSQAQLKRTFGGDAPQVLSLLETHGAVRRATVEVPRVGRAGT